MPMQESEYATLARRRRKNHGLKISTAKQLKRAKMEKKLCRVQGEHCHCEDISVRGH